jgi:hypothetical protein
MNNDNDIEERLRNSRVGPDDEVKRNVLSRYGRTFGTPLRGAGSIVFWRRPIPLYLTAAGVLAAALIAFYAGMRVPGASDDSQLIPLPLRGDAAITAGDLEWETAPNDVL